MKVIIIDDELNARLALRGIIEENFPEIAIIDECKDVPTAVKSIHKHKPDVIFLDISMPGYSGLELFQFFDPNEVNFKVIFVTAYSEYAINAFELSALDYILKPIRIEAIERAIHKIKPKVIEHLDVLQDNLEHHLAKKIALQTGDGITIIPLKDVLYLKADGSYTHFFTTDKKKITVSKKIAEYERLEQIGDFIRIHRSHIVNVDKVVKILKQDGGTVMMENGDLLSISNEKKQELIKMFEHKM